MALKREQLKHSNFYRNTRCDLVDQFGTNWGPAVHVMLTMYVQGHVHVETLITSLWRPFPVLLQCQDWSSAAALSVCEERIWVTFQQLDWRCTRCMDNRCTGAPDVPDSVSPPINQRPMRSSPLCPGLIIDRIHMARWTLPCPCRLLHLCIVHACFEFLHRPLFCTGKYFPAWRILGEARGWTQLVLSLV